MTTTTGFEFTTKPRAKSQAISIFRQYIAHVYSSQRLYKHIPKADGITDAHSLENLIIYYGSSEDYQNFVALIKKQEGSYQPTNDAVFAFIKKYDSQWFEKHSNALNKVNFVI